MKKINEIHKIIKQLQNLNKRIVFQWIPAHCGIVGNEQADMLAKKGSRITQTAKQNIPTKQ